MAARKKAVPEQPGALLVGDRDPTKPAPYEFADAAAIQALATGTANAGQQQRALRWIVEGAADTYGLSYRVGDPTATAFAEGKRHVGLAIVKLTNLSLGSLREREEARAKQAKAAEAKSKQKKGTAV